MSSSQQYAEEVNLDVDAGPLHAVLSGMQFDLLLPLFNLNDLNYQPTTIFVCVQVIIQIPSADFCSAQRNRLGENWRTADEQGKRKMNIAKQNEVWRRREEQTVYTNSNTIEATQNRDTKIPGFTLQCGLFR